MTDFVLSAGNTIRPHRSPWGAFPIRGFKLSTGISSQVIRVGTVVCLDSASTSFNDCIVPTTLSSSSLKLVANTVIGVSAEGPGQTAGGISSTNSQGTVIPVWEANPSVEFKAWTRGGLLNSTIVGQRKELTRDSTLNIDLVNLATSSLAATCAVVIITGLVDASGDSGGAVTIRFKTSSSWLANYK